MGYSILKSEEVLTDSIEFQHSGLTLPSLAGLDWLHSIQACVKSFFPEELQSYCRMDDGDCRDLAVQCQLTLNKQNSVQNFVRDNLEYLQSILGPEISYQSNLYLRCSRPNHENKQEQVGWHRETFYGPAYVKHAVNIWIPLVEISPKNAIWFVPQSHKIPESQIETTQRPDLHGGVERFSAGHKMGLLYAPKVIVSGVDLDKAEPLLVPVGSYAAFSAMMIHGNGVNTGNAIRFSVDFRLIPTHQVGLQDRKFSSGQEYFKPFVP